MTITPRKFNINTWLTTRLWLAFWFVLVFAYPVRAQFYSGSQMDFGKNRIQWGETIWSYYQFDKFDTYFYLNGSELALYTARYADKQLQIMERRLQTTLTDKVQFVVFNNLGDLKQSNIGLASEQQYNVGGITHIVGTKVILYFDGNYINFEKQIRAALPMCLSINLCLAAAWAHRYVMPHCYAYPDGI